MWPTPSIHTRSLPVSSACISVASARVVKASSSPTTTSAGTVVATTGGEVYLFGTDNKPYGDPFDLPGLHFTRESADSMALNRVTGGAIIMALGGVLSLTDRRYRVAAGARRVPQGVPAE